MTNTWDEIFNKRRDALDAEIMEILSMDIPIESRVDKIDPILYEKAALRVLRWYHWNFHAVSGS